MVSKSTASRTREQGAKRQRVRRTHSSRLQLEMETAARRMRRCISKPNQRARTLPPRVFALCACLFGDGPFLSKYVRGAVELAAQLVLPWVLWITIDDAAYAVWGAALERVPNVHLVRVAPAPRDDRLARTKSTPQRPPSRRSSSGGGSSASDLRSSAQTTVNNTPHLLTRYLLLDDPRLAAAVVVDLDVHAAEAAAGHMALVRYAAERLDEQLATRRIWAATDLLRDGNDNSEQRRARTNNGVGRYNAGAIVVANPKQSEGTHTASKPLADGIEAWVLAHPEALGHGCDERWLEDRTHGPLVPALAAGCAVAAYVESLRHGGESSLPRTHSSGRNRAWCLGESSLGLRGCGFDAVSATNAIQREVAASENSQLLAVHRQLTCPSASELLVSWLPEYTPGVARGH